MLKEITREKVTEFEAFNDAEEVIRFNLLIL